MSIILSGIQLSHRFSVLWVRRPDQDVDRSAGPNSLERVDNALIDNLQEPPGRSARPQPCCELVERDEN